MAVACECMIRLLFLPVAESDERNDDCGNDATYTYHHQANAEIPFAL